MANFRLLVVHKHFTGILDSWTMEEGRADSLIREILDQYKDQIDVKDPDAAIFLVTNCVEEMIHHLILHGSEIPEERVFEELARMVYRYLAKA